MPVYVIDRPSSQAATLEEAPTMAAITSPGALGAWAQAAAGKKVAAINMLKTDAVADRDLIVITR